MRLRGIASTLVVAIAVAGASTSWTGEVRAQLADSPVQLPPPPLPVPALPALPAAPSPTPPSSPVPTAPATPSASSAVGTVAPAVSGASGGGDGGSASSAGSTSGTGGHTAPGPPAPVSSPSRSGSASTGATTNGAAANGAAAGTSRRGDVRLRVSGRGVVESGAAPGQAGVVIRFELARPALVRFVIVRQAPDCATIGSFSRQGRRGLNRVVFRGRLGGEPLAVGTYVVKATAFRNGQALPLGRARVVVVRPGADPARARPAGSTCGDAGVAATIRARVDQGSGSARAWQPTRMATAVPSADATRAAESGGGRAGIVAAPEGERGDDRDGRIMGVPSVLDAPPRAVELLFIALIVGAVLLLIAAVPRATRLLHAQAAGASRRIVGVVRTGAAVTTIAVLLCTAAGLVFFVVVFAASM